MDPFEPAVDPGLDAKVAFLSRMPGARAIETHMSWVFLSGARAYKLKKPLHYRYIDNTTIGKRRAACLEEIRLNRRLAPDVYLGVVPLVVDKAGALAFGDGGAVVDWMVEMRRLPADRMLDRRLVAGTVTRDENHAARRRARALLPRAAVGADGARRVQPRARARGAG